ncbi:MAG: M28 family peptidase [Bacteroidales bacterium]|nr:M28 family peptidase [Bacteroidales bacterium]
MPSHHQLLRNFLIGLFLIGSFFIGHTQNMQEVRNNIKKLTSKSFAGRGYVKNGDKKAAKFLAKKFKKYGLEELNESYYQPYTFSINSFPKKLHLQIDQTPLTPAYDYIIKSSANSISGKFPCLYLPLSDEQKEQNLSQYFLVGNQEYSELTQENLLNAKGFISLENKQPIWSVFPAMDTSYYIVVHLDERKLADSIQQIQLDINSKYLVNHQSQNVWGMVHGKTYTDSLILITAHYDHLGMMGNAIYPGANDNASGIAMLLELAKHFSQAQNQPEVSILFVAFSGEEVGLLGSSYLANHFPFDLKKIQLQINLDMVGSGSEGITIVNGREFSKIFDEFKTINEEQQYLKEVKARSVSCNSDHCPLYEKGVPAIFIYTRGPEATAYHIPQDDFESLPLTKFTELFQLLRDFIH